MVWAAGAGWVERAVQVRLRQVARVFVAEAAAVAAPAGAAWAEAQQLARAAALAARAWVVAPAALQQ